jgi:hypothetical protein
VKTQEAEREVKERMAGIAMEQRRVEIGQRRRIEQRGYELERLQRQFERWSQACAICMAREGRVEELE